MIYWTGPEILRIWRNKVHSTGWRCSTCIWRTFANTALKRRVPRNSQYFFDQLSNYFLLHWISMLWWRDFPAVKSDVQRAERCEDVPLLTHSLCKLIHQTYKHRPGCQALLWSSIAHCRQGRNGLLSATDQLLTWHNSTASVTWDARQECDRRVAQTRTAWKLSTWQHGRLYMRNQSGYWIVRSTTFVNQCWLALHAQHIF